MGLNLSTDIRTCTCIITYTHVCTCTCIICTSIYMYMYNLRINIHVHVHVCVHQCTCTCSLYVYMYTYITVASTVSTVSQRTPHSWWDHCWSRILSWGILDANKKFSLPCPFYMYMSGPTMIFSCIMKKFILESVCTQMYMYMYIYFLPLFLRP